MAGESECLVVGKRIRLPHSTSAWGNSAEELGDSDGKDECPDIWKLSNGDVAVIGRDLTSAYQGRLPNGVNLAADERVS